MKPVKNQEKYLIENLILDCKNVTWCMAYLINIKPLKTLKYLMKDSRLAKLVEIMKLVRLEELPLVVVEVEEG